MGKDNRWFSRKCALYISAHYGVMLFPLSNIGIASGLIIEFDADKSELANELSERLGTAHLSFRQGDIDDIDPG